MFHLPLQGKPFSLFRLNPPWKRRKLPGACKAFADLRRRVPVLLPVDRGVEGDHRGPGGLRMLADRGAAVPSNLPGRICALRAVGRGGRLRVLRRGGGALGACHGNMVWPRGAEALSQGAGLRARGGGSLCQIREAPGIFSVLTRVFWGTDCRSASADHHRKMKSGEGSAYSSSKLMFTV